MDFNTKNVVEEQINEFKIKNKIHKKNTESELESTGINSLTSISPATFALQTINLKWCQKQSKITA